MKKILIFQYILLVFGTIQFASGKQPFDDFKPIPIYMIDCNGGVEIINGTVEDPLIYGDVTTRSNLADAYIQTDLSSNFAFKLLTEIVSGETIKANWQLVKINPFADAKAVLVFIDKAGNDTTITINSYITKLEIIDNLIYGNLKIGDSPVSKTFTITNNSMKIVTLDKLQLSNGKKGFNIEPLNWNLSQPMQISEKREVIVTFTPDSNLPKNQTIYLDSITIGDKCGFSNIIELRATIGTPQIIADDWNFGTFNIIAQNPLQHRVRVSNPSLEGDLIITGATNLTDSAFVATFGFASINKLSDITPQNPIILKANSFFEFDVYFKPNKVGNHSDYIVFKGNANSPDNTTYLNGMGLISKISINELDFGEYPITTKANPVNPLKGESNGQPVLTFVNNGSIDVIINYLNIKTISGNPASFLLDDQQTPITDFTQYYGNINIPSGGKVSKQIYFSPKDTGSHIIELSFDNDANIPLIAWLKGKGTIANSITETELNNIKISESGTSIIIKVEGELAEKLTYNVLTLDGKIATSGTFNQNTEINMKDNVSQAFFVEISNKNSVLIRKKLILLK